MTDTQIVDDGNGNTANRFCSSADQARSWLATYTPSITGSNVTRWAWDRRCGATHV